MNLLIKFAIVFAALGLVISLIFGFVAGNRVMSVITTALLCTVLSGALGGGTYQVLDSKVPEFLDIFRGETTEYVESDYADADMDAVETTGAAMDAGAGGVDQDAPQTSFGDHLLVNKVRIKNEPRLMAEAIRTMLKRDED